MIIGVGIDGRYGFTLDELVEIGTAALRAGYESIWTNGVGVPDAFHICAAWSNATHAATGSCLRSGIAVVSTRKWSPESLAAQAATVEGIAQGKFVLGIGTGGGAGLLNRPIGRMRQQVAALRGLFAGEDVNYEGKVLRPYRLPVGSAVVVPIYLAALGPQMLRLAGAVADGAAMSYATPDQIARSARLVAEGAEAAGRDPADVALSMYIRVCVDEDADIARAAFGATVLGYAMASQGVAKTLGYRGLFGRMGFDKVLTELEEHAERGATMDEVVRHAPDEMLSQVGYYGPPDGAAQRFASLSSGLGETIVRVIPTRPGVKAFCETFNALAPARIRNFG